MDYFRPRCELKIGEKAKCLIVGAYSSNNIGAESFLLASTLLIGGDSVTIWKFLETHSL